MDYIITNGYGFNQEGSYIKTDEGETVEGDQQQQQIIPQHYQAVVGGDMIYAQPYQQYVLQDSSQLHLSRPEQPLHQVVTTSVAEQLPPVNSPSIELSMSSPSHQQQLPQSTAYDSPEAVYNHSISSSESFTVKVESTPTTTLHPMG